MQNPADTIPPPQAAIATDPAADFRAKFMPIEAGLSRARSLFRFAGFVTGVWAILGLFTTVLFSLRRDDIHPPESLVPRLLDDVIPRTQLSPGIATAFLIAAYFLFNAAHDELRPGKGKRHTRALVMTLLCYIAIFGIFPLGLLLALEPTYWILNRRCKTVLSADYRQHH